MRYSTEQFIEAYTNGGKKKLSDKETSTMMSDYSYYQEEGALPDKVVKYFHKKNPRETIIVPENVPHNIWKIGDYLDRQISHEEQGRVYKASHNGVEFLFYVCDDGNWGASAEDICLEFEEPSGDVICVDEEMQKELLK